MSAPAVGDPLPNPTLQQADGTIALHELHERLGGGPLLVLFYREDATPSCTTQLCAFRDEWELIAELGASVAAISADGVESQQRFAAAQRFPFPLLSDPELAAARAFGVADEAAKRSERAAFVADGSGLITLAIPFYQPANLAHFQSVFEALGV